MEKIFLSWRAAEREYRPKDQMWYWAIGIAAGGIAIAAAIVGNYLFSLIAVIGAFAVMIAGSKKPSTHLYKLTDRGLLIGEDPVPYEKMVRFSVSDEPAKLTLETTTMMGTISASLAHTDWRAVRTELKNRNIEEVEHLGSFMEAVERGLGL